MTDIDYVNHPPHYQGNPEGIECIQVTRWMNFNVGNAVKYLWRVDSKDDPIENLEKAKWYIDDEIKRRKMVGGNLVQEGAAHVYCDCRVEPVFGETKFTKVADRDGDVWILKENGYWGVAVAAGSTFTYERLEAAFGPLTPIENG